MMRYVAPLALLGILSAEPARAAEIPTFVKEHAAYPELRPQLEKAGWVPADISAREDGACPDAIAHCVTYPEARGCSGTGLGFCSMEWTHPDGTKLVITTAGEAEGGPHVFRFETALGQDAMPAPPEAHTEGISQQRRTYLEGVWSGVPTDVSADKLCSTVAPPENTITLEFEFLRSGGIAFFDDGTESAARSPITAASEANGVISLTFNNEVWRFRPDGKDVMYRVRSSASLGVDVDEMVFKRCKGAADRSAIALDDKALKFFAADLPGDEAFFIDERFAAKTGNRCAVEDKQQLFFMLIGPAEFVLDRWNSFALTEKLMDKKPVKLPPLDPTASWRIENARADGKKFVFRIRDYENAKAVPETIHVEVKSDNSILIPEWRRTFIRCKATE